MLHPALAIVEFDSIAIGIEAGDAMVKRAPLGIILSGTVQPGKYLVLIAGDVASVEESVAAGRAVGNEAIVDTVFLPDIHPEVVSALRGERSFGDGEALGVIETRTVAGVIEAADAAVKGATVTAAQIELADGLGGKGYVLLGGVLSEVEAGVAAGVAAITSRQLIASVVIPRLHDEMRDDVIASPFFSERVRGDQ
ncbi:MAG: BMC domain-containing protein [Acidimicrobiia bacterium]|nr:BMC domain-containing protein [Acidimicrobiia bacterium]